MVAGAGVLLIEVNSLGCAVGACKFREPLLGALMTFRNYYSLPWRYFMWAIDPCVLLLPARLDSRKGENGSGGSDPNSASAHGAYRFTGG